MKKLKDIFDLRDYLVFGGLSLVSTGAGMIYLPAAFISLGLGLFGIGMNWFGKQTGAKNK